MLSKNKLKLEYYNLPIWKLSDEPIITEAFGDEYLLDAYVWECDRICLLL